MSDIIMDIIKLALVKEFEETGIVVAKQRGDLDIFEDPDCIHVFCCNDKYAVGTACYVKATKTWIGPILK